MFDIDYILVPLDFSRSSRAALSLARHFAAGDTRVEAVYAVNPWPAYMEAVLFPYAPLGEDAPEIEHELIERARVDLVRVQGLEEEGEGAPDQVSIIYGPSKEALVSHVRSTAADLVVMGAFGEGGPRPDALGSHAERIIRESGRTTILVRDFAPQAKIDKIVVAVDLGSGSRRVVEAALRLALRCGADLEMVHVIPDPLRDDHAQVLAAMVKLEGRKVTTRARDRVEALFEQLTREITPAYSEEHDVQRLLRRRRVSMGDPASTIATHANASGADLVVVGARDPGRPHTHLGRITATVARRCPTHVAVVPVPDSTNGGNDE